MPVPPTPLTPETLSDCHQAIADILNSATLIQRFQNVVTHICDNYTAANTCPILFLTTAVPDFRLRANGTNCFIVRPAGRLWARLHSQFASRHGFQPAPDNRNPNAVVGPFTIGADNIAILDNRTLIEIAEHALKTQCPDLNINSLADLANDV